MAKSRRSKKSSMTNAPQNLFSPSAAIRSNNLSLFVGRTKLLEDAIQALGTLGASLVVYGDRGAGKTSFARVLMHLLNVSGREQKKLFGFSRKVERPDKSFLRCVWQEVHQGIATLEDLLYHLLQPNNPNLDSLAQQFPDAAKAIEARYAQIDPHQVMAIPEKSGSKARQLNPDQKLVHLVYEQFESFVAVKYPDVVPLIMIDELELMQNMDGLGRLIKNSKSSFVLIGIAESVQDLVQDHQSANRKIGREYKIPRMSYNEVCEIFRRAEEAAAENLEAEIIFADDFLKIAFEDSAGIPGRCQKFGAAIVQRFQEHLEKGEKIEVKKADYLHVLDRTDNDYVRDSISSDRIDKGLSAGNARWKIIEAIGTDRGPEWIPVDDLNNFPPNVNDNLEKWIHELENDEVLEYNKQNRKVRFANSDLWGEVRRRIRTEWRP
jgi:Cdc6-like AAA superfamily ATPase